MGYDDDKYYDDKYDVWKQRDDRSLSSQVWEKHDRAEKIKEKDDLAAKIEDRLREEYSRMSWSFRYFQKMVNHRSYHFRTSRNQHLNINVFDSGLKVSVKTYHPVVSEDMDVKDTTFFDEPDDRTECEGIDEVLDLIDDVLESFYDETFEDLEQVIAGGSAFYRS